MKIRRFISSVIIADGGTTVCRVELADGSELSVGVDARIPKMKEERVLFVGADYPTKPGARVLAKDSKEEKEIVSALEDYLSCQTADADRSAADLMAALLDR